MERPRLLASGVGVGMIIQLAPLACCWPSPADERRDEHGKRLWADPNPVPRGYTVGARREGAYP